MIPATRGRLIGLALLSPLLLAFLLSLLELPPVFWGALNERVTSPKRARFSW